MTDISHRDYHAILLYIGKILNAMKNTFMDFMDIISRVCFYIINILVIHVILCAIHICCHGNGEIKSNKSEIKRELMERREWEQIMLQNSNWNTSTDED